MGNYKRLLDESVGEFLCNIEDYQDEMRIKDRELRELRDRVFKLEEDNRKAKENISLAIKVFAVAVVVLLFSINDKISEVRDYADRNAQNVFSLAEKWYDYEFDRDFVESFYTNAEEQYYYWKH